MAKLKLILTPKPKAKSTNTTVSQAIKLRAMVVDWKKTKAMQETEIIAEVTKAITDATLKGEIASKKLEDLPNAYPGKHELYVFWGKDKATKIDLTVEDEPVFDVRAKCPLFANPGSTKANNEYNGGGADDSHVHVYSSGFHLKLGKDRYNIVQNNTLYEEAIERAHDAVKSNQKKWGHLAPFVAAALKDFGKL